MNVNFLAFAVPFFLLFIGIEYWLSRRTGRNYFQYAESVANINVGIAERLLDVFTTGVFLYFFQWIYMHLRFFTLPANALTWILLFLLTDLVWYWYHRLAHEINLFWAVHVVHHQSEDFNYTVSARITVFQAIVRSMFWAVLPLLGFPPHMTTVLLLVHGLYPFFIHTQSIGKLGWIEKILVTPSHHRVHHASNPEYLDKNYGDVLIIWDKLFGTFVEEKAAPSFGLTKPLRSHSFLWQHFHFPLELLLGFRYASGWKNKLRVLFGKPEYLDPRLRSVLERRLLNTKPGLAATPILRQYVTAQTIVSLFLLFLTLLFEAYLSAGEMFFLSAFIIVSLVNSGAMLDQRQWVFYLEFARLLILVISIGVFHGDGVVNTFLLMLVGLLIYYFRPIQRRYLGVLYKRNRY